MQYLSEWQMGRLREPLQIPEDGLIRDYPNDCFASDLAQTSLAHVNCYFCTKGLAPLGASGFVLPRVASVNSFLMEQHCQIYEKAFGES